MLYQIKLHEVYMNRSLICCLLDVSVDEDHTSSELSQDKDSIDLGNEIESFIDY